MFLFPGGFEEVWRKVSVNLCFLKSGHHNGVYQLFFVSRRWVYLIRMTPSNMNYSSSNRWKLGLFCICTLCCWLVSWALWRLMLELSPSYGFGHWLTKGTKEGRETTTAGLRKPSWNVKYDLLSEEEDRSTNFPDVNTVVAFALVLWRSGAWESLDWQEWVDLEFWENQQLHFSEMEKSVYHSWKLSQLAPLLKWASWSLKPSDCHSSGSLP